MKTLSFTEENKESYDMLYETTRAHPVRGIEDILKAATVVEKLKEFGIENGAKTGGFQPLKLKVIPSSIELEDEHFRYVKQSFEEAQMTTSVKIELLAQTAKLLKSADT